MKQLQKTNSDSRRIKNNSWNRFRSSRALPKWRNALSNNFQNSKVGITRVGNWGGHPDIHWFYKRKVRNNRNIRCRRTVGGNRRKSRSFFFVSYCHYLQRLIILLLKIAPAESIVNALSIDRGRETLWTHCLNTFSLYAFIYLIWAIADSFRLLAHHDHASVLLIALTCLR
jgi:hypothetical protein